MANPQLLRPADRGGDRPLEADQELAFADASDRLPWLESDDDDERVRGGFDGGQILSLAAFGLLAVLVLLGGLYFLTRERSDPAMVADGSTIEAPDTPYKSRPADPGGRQVAGTGQTSFEVAEGRTVEGRVAEPVAMPSAWAQTPAAPSPAATAADVPPQSQGVAVQVGAYSSRALAETGWSQLSGRIPPLQGRGHRVVEGTADSGTIFRLQAVAGNVTEAEQLCRNIKAAGGDCQVKR